MLWAFVRATELELSPWRLVCSILGVGAVDDWPDALFWPLRSALFTFLGSAARRLVKVWDCWPWKLCKVFDPRRKLADRMRSAQEFLDVHLCCLDPGFGRKLRARYKTVAELMDPRVQRFVIQAFNSVPLATQWLECCFASVKQWLHTSLRPLSGATLAAKYVTHHMDTLWKAERDASNAPDTIFDSIEGAGGGS